ncbi:protein CTR9 homolog [Dendrobium catenatum]|uniref:protein CTR9 homolog n=1 Tax=Dendrobium catenatum TaxID=906689 RepID=UPI00109EFBB9|nr:protein CTR9 homolog [Dendrobium catenatum]
MKSGARLASLTTQKLAARRSTRDLEADEDAGVERGCGRWRRTRMLAMDATLTQNVTLAVTSGANDDVEGGTGEDAALVMSRASDDAELATKRQVILQHNLASMLHAAKVAPKLRLLLPSRSFLYIVYKSPCTQVRATVTDLKNAVRVFSQLSAASSYHSHGFDEKKIRTHVEYCKHLLDAAKVHCEAAEREEQQNRLKLEAVRQDSLAEEARRKADEQRKYQLERRKQEDELKRVIQQEENFERIKEQWKNYSTSGGKRKDRSHFEDDDGGNGERKRRKGGKRRKKDKRKDHYEQEADIEDEQEEMDEAEAKQMNSQVEEADRANAHLGLEDSDAEDDMGYSAIIRKRKAWSESDEEDEPAERIRNPTPNGYRNSAGSDEETRGNGRSTQNEEDDDY